MIYGLLWLESLAFCVLLVLWSVTGRMRAQEHRGAWYFVIAGTVTFSLAVVALQISISVLLVKRDIDSYLAYSVSFAAALILILAMLLWRGFSRAGDHRRIHGWSPARLGIAAGVAAALYVTTLMTADTTMQMKLANVRLEAGSLALSEAPPRPQERENAAVLYMRAFERIDSINRDNPKRNWDSDKISKRFNEADYDTAQPELRTYFASLRPALDLVRKASAMPACAFDRNYGSPSLSMRLPELAKMRQCARLLAADARFRAADGDVKGALENIQAVFGISEHMSYEPIMISGLVSIACYSIGTSSLEAILRTTPPSATDLAAWRNDDVFSFRRAYRRAIKGEYAFGLTAFAMLGDPGSTADLIDNTGMGKDMLALQIGAPLWRVYLLPVDLQSYSSIMQQMEGLGGMNYAVAASELKNIEKPQRHGGILTAMLVPALSRAHKSYHMAEARLRMNMLARAISAYRAKHNAYPKDLASLVPEFIADIPMDPFDDKPLRLIVQPAGVMIYSVGSNQIDENGAWNKSAETDFDIVLRLGNFIEGNASSTTSPPPGTPAPKLPGPGPEKTPEPAKSGF